MSNLALRQAARRVQLTPKQANIFAWGWQPEAKERFAVCGRRFGKTFLMMEEQRRAVRLAIERNIDTDNEIWYGAPTFKQAERVYWKRAIRATPPEWIAHINNQKMTITYHSGHVFRLVGLDNYDDLRGSGLFFFMGDEWADVKPEAWDEVVSPMLSTCEGHAIFIGTPKGFNHFYDGYARGVPGLAKHKHTMSWRYSTLDGGNVSSEWLDDKRATSDERTFRQEYEASFETYSGVIYYAFDRTQSIAVPPWRTMYRSNSVPNQSPYYNPNLPIHVGLDFNINPMTAHIYQETKTNDGKRIKSYQIDEIHIHTSNTHEMAREIKTRYGRLGFSGDIEAKHITIYPDPAGASGSTKSMGQTDISILRSAGLSVYAMSTHPLVRDRINLVNGRFCAANGERSLFIAPECKNTIEAVQKQQYKEGTSEPDKDSGFDHDNDATGYYVYTRFAHQKARPEQVSFMER